MGSQSYAENVESKAILLVRKLAALSAYMWPDFGKTIQIVH